ncbi:hypothetical protein AVEN_273539-1 [Araneus ventricosus]|uniref:Uncharacterized protein n=1 Tax=Araneus ventricosus TaxID=182803 RepID=A0A4Y2H5E0_ARAVE|nr:hypothetical protein AVEN_273539-1 [Araneus ventricosus]
MGDSVMETDDMKASIAGSRVQGFLEEICSKNKVSIDSIEKELFMENRKKRKSLERRRKLRFKIKELIQELNALEVSIDNSNIKISNLSEKMTKISE